MRLPSLSSLAPHTLIGVLLLATLALSATTGCKPSDSDASPTPGAAKAQEVKPMAVEVDTVRAQRFVQTLEFPGVAQPIESRRVAAEMGGKALEAPAVEGERVEKGDLLLRVDAQSTTAQVNLLQSQVSSARREYNRLKQLAAEGLATPQQLDQVESQVQQAELALKQARVGKGLSVVRSPFSGVVAMKMIEPGEFASPGAPIVELIDTSTIKLEVTIPESVIRYVKVGDEVQIVFSASDIRTTGTVARRGVMVTQPTQTFPIEIHIPNADGQILAGMRADVIIPKLSIDDAVVVPRDALLEGVFQREAMVVRDHQGELGKAELRVVEIGESKGNEVVITKGLKAGDLLITEGHRNVVDGTPVRIVRDHSAESAKRLQQQAAEQVEAAPAEAPAEAPKEVEP